MIFADGARFVDEAGRSLLLRGVNLDAKLPAGFDGQDSSTVRIFDHRTVSFVGRPFPLDEAAEHFARLAGWGLSFVRLLVPWEALEHEGPGRYDEAYLDYLYELVRKADAAGISVLIDARQDVWSRFSGGSGAPGWSLEIMGIDLTKLAATGAAVTRETFRGSFPKQVWNTNQFKYASATMFSLFFAGDLFASETKIEGVTAQEYLQRHWVEAYAAVAERLAGLPNLVGFNIMNEPSRGYIGCPDLRDNRYRYSFSSYMKGEMPSPFQAMLLASGVPQRVEVWQPLPPMKRGSRLLNEGGEFLFRPGYECPWRQNGVWGMDSHGRPVLRRPDHFASVRGRKVDFAMDCLRPFALRFSERIRRAAPRVMIVVNIAPSEAPPRFTPSELPNLAIADSWYDGLNWMLKSYLPGITPFVGFDRPRRRLLLASPKGVRRSVASQLRGLARSAAASAAPFLLIETGTCFDLNNRPPDPRSGFRRQTEAIDRILAAADEALASYTLWVYCPRNTNEAGDGWNGEDYSIFSLSQRERPEEIDSGGRALDAIVRPYPRAVAGTPLSFRYDRRTRACELRFRHDPMIAAPTELFVPRLPYPDGFEVKVSAGSWEFNDQTRILSYQPDSGQAFHTLSVRPR